MLCLIAGAAKSGKTFEINRRLFEACSSGKRALLIVPEQASFNNERNIGQMAGAFAKNARAVSFSRLAEQTLRRLGGYERAVASPAAEMFLMSVALNEISDILPVYGRSIRSRGFIGQMLQMVKECRNAGITPERLAVSAADMPEGPLGSKISELAIIYDAFEAVLRRSYISQTDMVTRAAEKLAASDELKNTEVFIDDFGGFTAPELDMISALTGCADKVTVSVCCDDIPTRQPAFELSCDTAARLIEIAKNCGSETEKVILPAPGLNGDLALMEKAQREEKIPDERCEDNSVAAILCESVYDELETVAAEISRMVYENGMRYRDFAVIARDLTRYRSVLPGIFARFGLPFFWDVKDDARTQLLTGGLLAAVKAACSVREGDFLEAARSPLMGIDPAVIGELENYCYVWSVKPSDWKRPFVNNPDGMTGRMSDSARERLERIENARRAVAEPIKSLANAIKSGRGGDIARGIWRFLNDIDAAGHINSFAAQMQEQERRRFLDEQALLWQQTVSLLELFEAVSADVEFTPERVCELLELAFGRFEVATVPRTLDEVTVGTADRIRCEDAKVVFLLGAVEGEFPSCAMPGGILSEPERRKLRESGLELLTEGDRSQATEKMLCYRAVTAPSQRLVVCCPKTDAAGAPTPPSDIFMRAKALGEVKKREPYRFIWSEQCLKKAIAESAGQQNTVSDTLLKLGSEVLGERETQALFGFEKPVHKLEKRETAQKLFGERLHISPSRLEQYYKCPFTYFMQKGLKAVKLQKAELSPMQAGTIIHRVLETLVKSHGGKGLAEVSRPQLRKEINAVTAQYIAECCAEGEYVPARLLKNIEQLGLWLEEMITRLGAELLQSGFEPAAFELPIGEKGAVKPMVLRTDFGEEISVEGTVDRVDTAVIGGKKYLRVVDYKSGRKNFSLDEVYYGLNLQMLIYLFSIIENGRGTLADAKAAGALYVPALGGYVSAPRNTDEYKLEKEARKQYTMNGLLLDEEQVLRAMEHDLEGVYIPVVEGKKSSSLYSEKELDKLKKIVEQKIEDMANRLYGGDIAAVPISQNGDTPCTHCDYSAVCGFEEGDAVLALQKLERDKILAEEGENDGD